MRKAGNFATNPALSSQRIQGVTFITTKSVTTKSVTTKSVTAKSVTAMAAAVLLAGLAVFFASLVPEARAETQVAGPLHQSDGKGDRLPALVMGAECSSQGWPHYEQGCQFDLRRPAHEARMVRIIALR